MNPAATKERSSMPDSGCSITLLSTPQLRSTEPSEVLRTGDRGPEPSDLSIAYFNRQYWYGHKCFDFLLAQLLFPAADQDTSLVTLDIELHAAQAKFPYAKALGLLRQKLVSPLIVEKDDQKTIGRQAYIMLVGLVQAYGTDEEKKYLDHNIQENMQNLPPAPMQRKPDKSYSLKRRYEDFLESDLSDTSDLPMYTVALNEQGNRYGPPAVFEMTMLSLDPPRFQCRVRYHGQSFVAIAKNKKLAKHLAAREACQMLGIRK